MASNASSTRTTKTDLLADKLLGWFDQHGRHDLPWQSPRTAYRVWISEIMLQQTQVTTVIPYFERFMQHFPDIRTLADAPLDDVLHQWTGLGYYARARNLHHAAIYIKEQHHGKFPTDFDAILALPGIGRSTAGAILAQAHNQRFAILDGNVKRVLTRLFGIEGWPGNKAVENQLWELAEQLTPHERVADYTQAIMDLGATVCKRSKPECTSCPLQHDCVAHAEQRQHELPTRKPKKTLPVRSTRMLMLLNDDNAVLLEQRPPSGIWGGLWSFPECDDEVNIEKWCTQHLQLQLSQVQTHTPLRHTFSHYHLDITPVSARARHVGIMDSDRHIWYNTQRPDKRGLPAPVKTLLQKIEELL